MDALSRHAWELAKSLSRAEAAMITEGQRTAYVIKMGALFVAETGNGHHWAQTGDVAKRFASMTAANGHAVMVLGMGPTEYTVEAI